MNIVKGLPIPPAKKFAGEKKYFWERLEVGDCFIAPDASKNDSIRSTAIIYGKRHGVTFAMRKIDGLLHVWRVS